jgi:hypothetical protein
MVKRLLVLGLAVLFGRWLALELASHAAHRWLRPAVPRPDRPPGRMPGPLDA